MYVRCTNQGLTMAYMCAYNPQLIACVSEIAYPNGGLRNTTVGTALGDICQYHTGLYYDGSGLKVMEYVNGTCTP